MASDPLSTMQRNALCRLFGRKDFSPEEVAALDYNLVAGLPKIGSKGIGIIRGWLRQYGHDLKNIPEDNHKHARRRLEQRLLQARLLLRKHGYRIEPPA